MRVTNLQTTRNFIELLNKQRGLLEDTQHQISTGLKISRASDDPGRSGTIAQFQATLQRLERHKERIAYATNFLNQQEGILGSSEDLLIRAKELATQAANGTMSVESREQIAEEVWQLRDSMIALANTKVQGLYIYHGAQDGTPPFEAQTYTPPGAGNGPESERYVYDTTPAGADQTRSVAITDSLSVRVNTPGNEVFTNAIAALERLGRALEGYTTNPAPPALPDGTGGTFNFPADYDAQTADITEAIELLDSARLDDISRERTDVAGRLARITLAESMLDTVKIDTENARATIQNVDIVEASSNFANYQTSLEATLASGTQLTRLSLLDFL